MRVLCLIFLIAFLGTVGIFAYQNQDTISISFLDWTVTRSVALVVAGAYALGMLSGWTIIGLLRRSFHRVADGPIYHHPPQHTVA